MATPISRRAPKLCVTTAARDGTERRQMASTSGLTCQAGSGLRQSSMVQLYAGQAARLTHQPASSAGWCVVHDIEL